MVSRARTLHLVDESGTVFSEHMSFTLMGFTDWMVAQSFASTTIKQRVWFAEARLSEWGTFDLPAHFIGDWLRERSGHTQRTYLTHLRSIYKFMLELGVIAVSPVARLRADPMPDPRPTPLKPQELTAALDASSGDLRAWLLLGYLAGFRCHETAKVRGEDFTETSLTIYGKGRKTSVLPLHPALWALAQDYPREGYWFPSPQARRDHVCTSHVENSIRDLFRSVGITHGAGHRLRYSYASALSRAGTQPRVVQTLLRHSQLNTTMRYIGVDEDEQRKALAALSVA